MEKIAIWVHSFDIAVDFSLPTFETQNDTYKKYAPGIITIRETDVFAGLVKYYIETDQSVSIREIRAQIENLAAFHAQECDSPEFDNAENLTQCA